MQCINCHFDVPITARFCPSCATPILMEDDIKSPDEVSEIWIQNIFKTQGYTVVIPENEKDIFFAKHNENANLSVGVRHKISLITMQCSWNLKKPTWGQKTDFLLAVNKANRASWFCACFAADSLDSITISTLMWIPERLSKRDIIGFLESFNKGIYAVIKEFKDFS